MGDEEQVPLLFRYFPDLKKKVPWISLGLRKTPVEMLPGLGMERLWIKRDDLTSADYGGNKIRKLEFALAEVLKKGRKRVVTFGGIGTNHGLATAIFCRKLGLECTVLLYDQPVTCNVKENLSLLLQSATEVVCCGSFLRTALNYFVGCRITSPASYFLYPGGSNILGTIGFVNAAFELKEQVERGIIPEPEVVFCPVGSNGTMAGLLLGCQLAGLKTKVIGVRVSISCFGPIDVCTPQAVHQLASKTYRYLTQQTTQLPAISIPEPTLLDNYIGEGYGYPTEKGKQAYQAMKAQKNLLLDPCYSAKTFAAVLDYCNTNPQSTLPVLFWNTYNSAKIHLAEPLEQIPNRRIQSILAAKETDWRA